MSEYPTRLFYECSRKEEKDYGWDEIKHLFCEVSLAVREIMNHRWMNKKGDLDKELFKACRNLDLAGVKNAIEKGANVNAIDDCGSKSIRCISPTSGKVRFANRDF